MANENYSNIVVYGQLNEEEVMFIRLEDVKYYSSIHRAHKEGISYGELLKKIPDFFDQLMEHYVYICEFDVSLSDIQKTNCDSYFDELENSFFEESRYNSDWIERAEDLYELVSNEDGDKEFTEVGFKKFYGNELVVFDERLPLKDEIFSKDSVGSDTLFYEILHFQPRMDWVPDKIESKYGKVMESMHDGDFLYFSPEDEGKIVTDFESLGFKCIKDEKLILSAYGDV